MEYLLIKSYPLVAIIAVIFILVIVFALSCLKCYGTEVFLIAIIPTIFLILLSSYTQDCINNIPKIEKELPSIEIDYNSTCLLLEEEFTHAISENNLQSISTDEIVSLVNEGMPASIRLFKDDSSSTGAYYLTYTANIITKNEDIPASLAISDTIPVTVSVIRDEVTVFCGSPLDPIRELWVLELISYDGESLEPYKFSWSIE